MELSFNFSSWVCDFVIFLLLPSSSPLIHGWFPLCREVAFRRLLPLHTQHVKNITFLLGGKRVPNHASYAEGTDGLLVECAGTLQSDATHLDVEISTA